MRNQAVRTIPKTTGRRPFQRMALLIVDMQDHREDKGGEYGFSYNRGTVRQGIEKFCSLITTAKEMGLPIMTMRFNNWFRSTSGLEAPETIEEIKRLLKNYGKSCEFTKKGLSAFDVDVFRQYLEDLGAETLIIGGYHAAQCVPVNVQAAIDSGLQVIASDEIVFGDNKDKSTSDGLKRIELAREAIEFYRFNPHVTYLETVEDIIEIIKAQNSL